MKTCGNKISCNAPVDTQKYHVRIEERFFCCGDCAVAYVNQENRFEQTMFPREGSLPLNYKPSRQRFYGSGSAPEEIAEIQPQLELEL